MNEKQKQKAFDNTLDVACRHISHPFLNRIVTCDEKWNLYGNHKCSAQWLDEDELPKHTQKRNIHQKKQTVSVWWSSAGATYYDFMNPGSSIIKEIY